MSRHRTVEIDLRDRRYPIHVGAGIIGEHGRFAPHVGDRHVFVVTNETVAPSASIGCVLPSRMHPPSIHTSSRTASNKSRPR